MTKLDELKERFPNLIPVHQLRANVSILELALQYGYQPRPQKGKSRPVLEHPDYKDTIIIKNPQQADQQLYQCAGDFTDSGTIIDFIRNRLATVFLTFNHPDEHEFKNITSVLYDYLRIDPNHLNQHRNTTARLTDAAPKQPFDKDQFDIRPLENTNYLTQRNIAPQTLQRPEFTGKVVAQVAYFNPQTGHTEGFLTAKEHPERNYLQFTNVAFPYYNGLSSEITGFELRNETIKLHAPGSDRFGSVFITNTPPKAERFYVMESAIDALSHQQLRSIRGDNAFNAVYVSTGGQLTPQQINTITAYISRFEKSPDWTLNLAFDNDAKGHRFDLQLIEPLIATQFPLSATTGGRHRVSYRLPEPAPYKPIREALLSRLDAYNQNVQAQFNRTDQDKPGQNELLNQQVLISRSASQTLISLPASCVALRAFTRDLLELTGLSQRIVVEKARGKDFNEDLSQEVKQGEPLRYRIVDETGQEIASGHIATLMARTLNQLRHQAQGEGQTKTFTLEERMPFGFRKQQVQVRIEQGISIDSTQTPEFYQQLQEDKCQRSQSGQPSPPSHPTSLREDTELGQMPQSYPE